MFKNRLQGEQRGASAIGLVITLVVIGYGSYVGIQYFPQLIEAQTIESIFDSLRQENVMEPFSSAADVKSSWAKLLNINEMNDLKDIIEIDHYRGNYTVKVKYDRELDLLYEKKILHYEKSMTLD